jgi:hypothetical protein
MIMIMIIVVMGIEHTPAAASAAAGSNIVNERE